MKPEQFALHALMEDKHWWFVARRAIIVQLVHQLVSPSKDVCIVDVGCGAGGVISALAETYDCIGVDTSEEAIKHAGARFPDLTFICGHAPTCLGSRLSSVDMFLLMDVLEHVESDGDLLEELFDALKPGGQILLTVPANMSMWSPQDENYGHYRRYEPEGLMRLWDGLPVTVRLFSYFNTYLYPLIRGIRILTKLRGREWGEASTDLALPPTLVNRLLQSVYSREATPLKMMVSERNKSGFPFGVSLIACLRKDADRE